MASQSHSFIHSTSLFFLLLKVLQKKHYFSGLWQHRRKDRGGENNMCRFEADYVDKADKINTYVQLCW